MKSAKLMTAMGLGLLVTPLAMTATAQEPEWSANVAITTDYVWRGISQSNEDWAIQGGFDVAIGGFYAGTWASNVDFEDGADDTNMEIDLYAGYGGSFANGLGYDVGVIYYAYPDNDAGDLDFFEVYGGLSYEFESGFGLGGSLNYDPDNQNLWAVAEASYGITEAFSVDGSVGNYSFDGGGDYTGWALGGTYSFDFFDLDVRYWDTDIDGSSIAEDRIVLTISKSM